MNRYWRPICAAAFGADECAVCIEQSRRPLAEVLHCATRSLLTLLALI